MPTTNRHGELVPLNGKAFEYVCLAVLHNRLLQNQPVVVEASPVLQETAIEYSYLTPEMREKMGRAATVAVQRLIDLEPQLQHPGNNIPLTLSIQPDLAGRDGDVRDILAIRQQNDWEIGVSVKWNHEGLKHSRLSLDNDFGANWLGLPCSQIYFDDIRPIFAELVALREQRPRPQWKDIANKHQRFYVPILDAFVNEVQRLYDNHGGVVAERMVQYIIGRYDFYKIIGYESAQTTKLQAFNFNGTLTTPSGSVRALHRIPRLGLPQHLHSISRVSSNGRVSNTTVTMVFDAGWQISARMHSASGPISSASLKFDMQLRGHPPVVYSYDEAWAPNFNTAEIGSVGFGNANEPLTLF